MGLFPSMPEMLIKGITLKSRVEFIIHEYGEGGLQKLVESLEGMTKDLFSDTKKIRATSWYDFKIQVDVDTAIYKVLADGDGDVYLRMGAFTADFQEDNLSIPEYKDPWKFLQLQGVIFGRYFKPGRMELKRVGPTEVCVRIHEFRSSHENCMTNIGFFMKSLENMGLKNVLVEETQCSEDPDMAYCEYRVKWET